MFDLPAAPLDAGAGASLRSTALRDAPPLRSVDANGAELRRAAHARRVRRGATRRSRGAHPRRLDRHRPVGQQDVPRRCRRLLYIGNVDELKRIDERDGVLSIGAAASLEDAWRALVARWPTLAEVWLRFAGVPLRHTGTMGGNVANGSPIGDSAPVLMALDASLVLRRGDAIRRVPLADFYTGYMQNRLAARRVRAGDRGAARPARDRARLQDLEAVRLRHLGRLRRLRDRAR